MQFINSPAIPTEYTPIFSIENDMEIRFVFTSANTFRIMDKLGALIAGHVMIPSSFLSTKLSISIGYPQESASNDLHIIFFDLSGPTFAYIESYVPSKHFTQFLNSNFLVSDFNAGSNSRQEFEVTFGHNLIPSPSDFSISRIMIYQGAGVPIDNTSCPAANPDCETWLTKNNGEHVCFVCQDNPAIVALIKNGPTGPSIDCINTGAILPNFFTPNYNAL